MWAEMNNEPLTKEPTLERTAAEATEWRWGLIFFTGQIFTLDSDVAKQNLFGSHGGFLTYPMYHRMEIFRSINKLWWNK